MEIEKNEGKDMKRKFRELIRSKRFRSGSFVIFTAALLTATSFAVNAAIVKKENNEVKESAGTPTFQEVLKSYATSSYVKSYPISYGGYHPNGSYPKSYPQSYPKFQLKESKVTKLSDCESEYANGNFVALKFDFNSCEVEYKGEEILRTSEYGVPASTIIKFKDLKENIIYLDVNLYEMIDCGGPSECTSDEPIPTKVSDEITRRKVDPNNYNNSIYRQLNLDKLEKYHRGYFLNGTSKYNELMSQESTLKSNISPQYCYSGCSFLSDGLNKFSSGIKYNQFTSNSYKLDSNVITGLYFLVENNSEDLTIPDNFVINFKIK
jgi:hypothetical protein